MATQAATASWLLRAFAAVAAAQTPPAAGSGLYKHPAKGQWNMPGRLPGWEDSSKVRFSASVPTLGGTVTAAEITILQRLNPDSPATVVDKLVLQNGVFNQTASKPIAPGSYTAYVSLLTGTAPVLTVDVFLQGLNEDFL